uniref:BORE2 protein n=1 Tax=Laticauda laticaudata TaxID=8630 RepID=A0A8C5RN53_LATLA
MALRKQLEASKKRSADSGVEPDRSVLSKEQRHQRISLFLQDFDHQAKEHLQEMKKELASLLQMAEKAFQVELLALPPAMRKMKRKDLLVKVTTIVEYKEAEDKQGMQSKKTSQKVSGKRIIVHSAFLKPVFFASLKAPLYQVYISKTQTKLFLSTLTHFSLAFSHRGLSTGPSQRTQASSLRSSSMPPERSLPFVNIPLTDGQTLCSSGDDIQNIDVQLLNNDTVQHIHTLVVSVGKLWNFPSSESFSSAVVSSELLTALCGKATVKSS